MIRSREHAVGSEKKQANSYVIKDMHNRVETNLRTTREIDLFNIND